MSIPNIVPRGNDDGETLGTALKQWSNVHTKELTLNGSTLSSLISGKVDTSTYNTKMTSLDGSITTLSSQKVDKDTYNTDMALKAPLASPALTGTPTVNGKDVQYIDHEYNWASTTGSERYRCIYYADGRYVLNGLATQLANRLGITITLPHLSVAETLGYATVVGSADTGYTGMCSFSYSGDGYTFYFTVREHDYSTPTYAVGVCYTIQGRWK